jgi:hypothetical protein
LIQIHAAFLEPRQSPDTILKKIENCEIFIPDVSFVARTDAGKLVPNPNVMIEFGFAVHARTHAAIMPVMNTTFGSPEQLPFDMRHLRHPIQYSIAGAASDSERRNVRNGLSRKIENRLRLQINAAMPTQKGLYSSHRMHLRLCGESLDVLS